MSVCCETYGCTAADRIPSDPRQLRQQRRQGQRAAGMQMSAVVQARIQIERQRLRAVTRIVLHRQTSAARFSAAGPASRCDPRPRCWRLDAQLRQRDLPGAATGAAVDAVAVARAAERHCRAAGCSSRCRFRLPPPSRHTWIAGFCSEPRRPRRAAPTARRPYRRHRLPAVESTAGARLRIPGCDRQRVHLQAGQSQRQTSVWTLPRRCRPDSCPACRCCRAHRERQRILQVGCDGRGLEGGDRELAARTQRPHENWPDQSSCSPARWRH